MRKVLGGIIISVFFQFPVFSFASQPISPAEGDSLYHLHVLFRWDQIPQSSVYQLQVAKADAALPFEDSLVVDLLDSTTAAVVRNGLEWGHAYVWRVRGLDSTGTPGSWQRNRHFFTHSLPPFHPNLQAVIFDSTQYSPGVTLLDDWQNPGPSYPAAVDMHGNMIWFSPAGPCWDQRMLNSGNILSLYCQSPQIATLDHQIKWQVGNLRCHHEINPLPNGHFMTLTHHYRWIHTWADSAIWSGDVILEIDQQGDTVWSWNAFDHFSTLDYDSADLASIHYGDFYDWTHGNACTYVPAENAIYYSSRNLSRITKIDRATGDIIWTMGARMASGQAMFGDSLFWFQHAPEPQPDGHLLIYNNNSYLLPPSLSSTMEIEIDFAQPETARVVWQYQQPEFSAVMGDADRLPNGNTLICAGSSSYLTEVNPAGRQIWRLNTHLFMIYRAERILSLYPQVFSIQTPDQDSQINPGSGTVVYRIFNEGTVNDTFHVSFHDLQGWFAPETEDVIVAAGLSAQLLFPYNAPPSSSPDSLFLQVQSSLNPESVDLSSVCVRTSLTSAAAIDSSAAFEVTSGPNPFNQTMVVRFYLPAAEEVALKVFNLAGQQINVIRQGILPPGRQVCSWNASGRASGAYLVRLEIGERVLTKRVVVLK